jgi:catechol 2,3-dioxygenase
MGEKAIDPRVHIGHVHLKVANLQRALDFYCGVLGLSSHNAMAEKQRLLPRAVTIITLDSIPGKADGSPPPQGTTGLYHFAILWPTRAALAEALRRLMQANISLAGASDHGVSEALYLSDPDGNGIELYWDRPRELWPRDANGQVEMFTRRLDVENLLADL